MALVPLRVIALMPPPEKLPCRTSYGDDDQLEFLDGVEADRLCFGRASGVPAEAAMLNRSLLTAPSIWRLL